MVQKNGISIPDPDFKVNKECKLVNGLYESLIIAVSNIFFAICTIMVVSSLFSSKTIILGVIPNINV